MTERGVAAAASHLFVKPRSAPAAPFERPTARDGTTRGTRALMDVGLAAKDRYCGLAQEFETLEGIVRVGCLVR